MSYLSLQDLDTVLTPLISWRWIWRVRAPENVCFMLSLLMHNSLPTRQLLSQRSIIQDDQCPRCGEYIETSLRCLRDCHAIAMLWRCMSFIDPTFFAYISIHGWIEDQVKGNKEILFFPALCWIWRWRYNVAFEGNICWDNTIVLRQILWLDYAVKHSVDDDVDNVSQLHDFTWNPPLVDFVKINVDGSVMLQDKSMDIGGFPKQYKCVALWFFILSRGKRRASS
ncbi:Reverse transcriptase zinc-binding domain [Sesbania bispinosa]|nr:Reverse transcriptase zinc-binding domain [Sesbania bispinosa]